jgi:hypothetical protein
METSNSFKKTIFQDWEHSTARQECTSGPGWRGSRRGTVLPSTTTGTSTPASTRTASRRATGSLRWPTEMSTGVSSEKVLKDSTLFFGLQGTGFQ